MTTSRCPRLSCSSAAMRLRSFSWEAISCCENACWAALRTLQLRDAILPRPRPCRLLQESNTSDANHQVS